MMFFIFPLIAGAELTDKRYEGIHVLGHEILKSEVLNRR